MSPKHVVFKKVSRDKSVSSSEVLVVVQVVVSVIEDLAQTVRWL